MNKPLFSIIIPTYNRAHLIGKTIQSVLEQTYTNFEVIIVDDGGTDNTKEVVQGFNDNRLQYYWKENGERGAARNFGARKSNGSFVTFLDSDDCLKNNHLSIASNLITKKPDTVFFHLGYEIITSDNVIIKTINRNLTIYDALLKGNALSCIGVFIQKELFLSICFYEDIRFNLSEDWLLWLKLAARVRLDFVNLVTSQLIQHSERSVATFNEAHYIFCINVLITELKNDTPFLTRYNQYIPKIHAHMLSYTALHAALANKKGLAIRYLIKAGFKNPVEWFTKRTLGIVKNILWRR